MGQFRVTEWALSKEVDKTQIAIEEGEAYLFIRNASYSDDTGIYTLDVENLSTEAQFQLRFYRMVRDDRGNMSVDPQTNGTLISLGKALAGVPIGVPNPIDVKGGVVKAYIYVRTSAKGNMYPRVYHFQPVNEDMAMCATIDQYYEENEPQDAAATE